MTINTFLKTQSEIVGRFESGFSGYQGLSGPAFNKPSPIVEKILKTLMKSQRERNLQRKNSIPCWTTSASDITSIPPRFTVIDQSKTTRKSRSFKDAAYTVLKSKSSDFPEEKATVDLEEDEEAVLGYQESAVSTTSVDSDWSDEEDERLERVFGAMFARGDTSGDMFARGDTSGAKFPRGDTSGETTQDWESWGRNSGTTEADIAGNSARDKLASNQRSVRLSILSWSCHLLPSLDQSRSQQ